MPLPVIKGVIERRLLVNFRADPSVVARMLPPPFVPQTAHGYAVVGICLIRLGSIRPTFLPAACGVGSENAAHRIAVRWPHNGGERSGVYIPRRDTSSRLNALIGGRLFPGVHNRADFRVVETPQRCEVEMTSRDGRASVALHARISPAWPGTSVFSSLDEASDFFRNGSLGYSARRERGVYDGLELRCRSWKVESLAVETARSSFFDNAPMFPKGSVDFDCALLMRNVDHEWHARGQLCCPEQPALA
jgi:uncharacterized protein YqjF (DUF2071 family)